MKIINLAFGIAAARVSSDAVNPLKHLVMRDFVNKIAQRYEFTVRPNIQVALSTNQFAFQAGAWKKGEERIPILQLLSFPNGDLVMAATTETADEILTDFIGYLSAEFNFRYESAKQQRFYQSNVVVQFSGDLAKKLDGIGKIEAILNRERNPELRPFKIKRFNFGYGDPTLPIASIEGIEAADFVIERRAGTQYEENIFFCSAPMSTEAHLKLLEEIDNSFSG